jgi:iron complex outermembrane recepter protein
MTRSRKRKLQRTGLALTGMPLASLTAMQPAQAQEQPNESSAGLQTVVVSAQKRDESLQDVPISVTALGTAQLEELNVSDFEDYVKFLPSVAMQTTAPGFSFVYMRGVASGENGNHSTSLPSVGVYLDEQPVTTIQGALDIHVYDVARVEALAGPQGTLYGASSQAGTLRIITNKPDPTRFQAGYDLEINSIADGEQGYVAEGFVNIPINDNTAVRLVGWYDDQGGYIDNVPGTRTFRTSGGCVSNAVPTPTGCVAGLTTAEEDYNDTKTYGARAALRVDLSDTWTITPTLMAQKSNSGGGFQFNPNTGDLARTHFYPDNFKDEWWQAALTVQGKISNLEVTYAGAHLKRDDETNLDYSDYAYFYDVQEGYGVYFYGDDGNPLADPSQFIQGSDGYKKQSHEIRFATPADRRVRFVGGLFTQKQTHDIFQRYLIRDLAEVLSVAGWDDTIWLTNQARRDEERAIFGELTVDLTEKLAVTGGFRWFEVENSLRGFFGFAAGYSSNYGELLCFSPTQFRGSPCTNLNDSVSEDGIIPKVNLTYKLTEDKLLYTTFSKGFRPGGINRNGTVPPYETDFLKNYEIGWKTTWAGNRFRWNGAAFFEEIEDIQFSFLPPSGAGLSVVRNAGSAEIKGVESSFEWAPTEALSFSAGATALDAKLTSDYISDVDAGIIDAPSGTKLPAAPDFKANLTARFRFPVGTWEGHMQGSMVYNGSVWSDLTTADRDVMGKQDSYSIFDFSAGIARNGYRLELYAANLFDERAVLFRTTECITTVCGKRDANPALDGARYAVPARPRTIGLKFGKRF